MTTCKCEARERHKLENIHKHPSFPSGLEGEMPSERGQRRTLHSVRHMTAYRFTATPWDNYNSYINNVNSI